MASFAEELHLRLIYWRIAVLRAAAANLSQQQQANAARNRVTAELVRRGWRVPEIAAALGKTYRQVRHWYDQGRTLDCAGLALPTPSRQPASDRLTAAEVAERLRVDVATIRRWLKDGHMLGARTSKAPHAQWVIEPAELERLGVPAATLTVAEIARQHGVQPMTVRGWISRGHLPAITVMPGGAWRIPYGATYSTG